MFYCHLFGNGVVPPSDPWKGNEEFIFFHHFHPLILKDDNGGPMAEIPADIASIIGLTKHDKQHDSSGYYPAPNYTLSSAYRDVEPMEEGARIREALIFGEPVPEASVRRSPDDRELLQVHATARTSPGKISVEYCRMKEEINFFDEAAQ